VKTGERASGGNTSSLCIIHFCYTCNRILAWVMKFSPVLGHMVFK
jgi:hypothetical protein